MKKPVYLCIDLKSFYASVECVERSLDPLKTHLVVADESRTEKTICLAVSPSLKSYGIPSRARLFEVIAAVKEINRKRGFRFEGESYDADELASNPKLKLTYVTARPRMAHYIEYSSRIYSVYLSFVSERDIHVYSIDEVFIDLTPYLSSSGLTAHEMAMRMIKAVLRETGITATAGIGSNLYLAKVAMDIVAKHTEADEDGVRIAELDERSYREKLWAHEKLSDFWRIGRGYERKLNAYGMKCMGDVARCSLGREDEFFNEALLHKLFGVNAELLIDHAWGYEPCTMEDIKNYKPSSRSLSSGQVLQKPYSYDQAEIVLLEMAEELALDLVDKGLFTDQIVLTVGYDSSCAASYKGPASTDYYGRIVPKSAHGTENLAHGTASARDLKEAALAIYRREVDKSLLIRRINIACCRLSSVKEEQYELGFGEESVREESDYLKEERAQKAVLSIKKKFGKNAIVKLTSLQKDATGRDRNSQIGGHKA